MLIITLSLGSIEKECVINEPCYNEVIYIITLGNQRTNGPVNAHLISWPSKAQNIQNLENIW